MGGLVSKDMRMVRAGPLALESRYALFGLREDQLYHFEDVVDTIVPV